MCCSLTDFWDSSCSCFTLTGESGSGDHVSSSVTHLGVISLQPIACNSAVCHNAQLSQQRHVSHWQVRTGSASKALKRKYIPSSNWEGCHQWPGQESTVFVPVSSVFPLSEGSSGLDGGCVMGHCGQNRCKKRGNGNYWVLASDKDPLFDLRNTFKHYLSKIIVSQLVYKC